MSDRTDIFTQHPPQFIFEEGAVADIAKVRAAFIKGEDVAVNVGHRFEQAGISAKAHMRIEARKFAIKTAHAALLDSKGGTVSVSDIIKAAKEIETYIFEACA